MTSPTEIEYDCNPACVPCRKNGGCPLPELPANTHEWAPNRLPTIILPCGCRDIPWPLLHYFGTNIYEIWCDLHGVQRISKAKRTSFRKQTNKIAKQTNQPTLDDIPPF